MFGKQLLNLKDNEIILCEGCGGVTFYGSVECKSCKTIIKSSIYDTGLEHYCKCQTTLNSDFDDKKW